jgi:transposase
MTPQQRLEYHQKYSKPTMDELRATLIQYVDQKIYEPNSKPMKAVAYILKRWYELTIFLRVAGAPLDSNSVEQALKSAIRIRKNSMFFKTFESARLSCAIISITMTAIRADENPVDYLTILLKYQEYVRANPEDWLPWEFKETLALLEEDSARQALAS